jgi:hypothetical protein
MKSHFLKPGIEIKPTDELCTRKETCYTLEAVNQPFVTAKTTYYYCEVNVNDISNVVTKIKDPHGQVRDEVQPTNVATTI